MTSTMTEQDGTETISQVRETLGSPEDETIESPQDRLIDSVTATHQDAIDSIESVGSAVVEGLDSANRSLADFLAERIRQDLATQRALLQSRSIEEARTIGFAHLRATVDQYGREVARMVRLGTTVAQRSLERPRLAVRGA